MPDDAIDILGLTSDEFISHAAARHLKAPQALEIYRSAFRSGSTGVDWASIDSPPIVNTLREHGTIKFIQRHSDNLETESVILPITSIEGRQRITLCVSSQVGCAMGCT